MFKYAIQRILYMLLVLLIITAMCFTLIRLLPPEELPPDDIHTVIVIGQLQAGEHTPDQSAFAGTGIADDTDELIGGGQVLLGDLTTQSVHTVVTARGIVGT